MQQQSNDMRKTLTPEALLAAAVILLASGCGGSGSGSGASAVTNGRQLYVSAAAPAGGDGSSANPFNTLAAVEQAAAAGDTIVVMAVPANSAPLDGGIALKPNQKLIGQAAGTGMLAQITNRSARLNSGDAVTLAPGAEVAGLAIVKPYRGGIYGLDVPGVSIHDNDVSGHNTSCNLGFIIPTDVIPTNIPHLTVPFPVPLPNGWAGIMVDADQGSGSISIQNNTVHDAPCADGIDVRLKGSAVYQADIGGNTVFNLKQGPILNGFLSVLAIGMQTRDTSKLTATLDNNTEHDIGSNNFTPEEADSEGVFANVVNASTITAEVDNNNFYHGIGGFSANGMEMPVMGQGGTAIMHISNSSFTDVPGDVLEVLALGTDGNLQLTLDNVTASRATGGAPLEVLAGLVASTNVGDCLSVNSSGSGNAMTLTMTGSTLSNCYHNGVTFASNTASGAPPGKLISFDIENSHISANQGYGLHLLNLAPLTQLTGKVANTSFSGNRDINIGFDNQGGSAGTVELDFGGGSQNSPGGNCIVGGGKGGVSSNGYDASLKNNWWGNPAGPTAAMASAQHATLDDAPALSAAPSACQ
ncbi:MAG: hypothetical protein P4L83_25545 [Nevskia sp.]|nr:hypothetical protein [Nevskia sp.]